MTHADLEPLSAVIRVYADGCKHPDPYVWTATVKFINPETVEIIGAMRAPTPSEWRAIMNELARHRIKLLGFCRIKNGQRRSRLLKVRPGRVEK